MRNFLLVSLTLVATAGLIWVATRDDDADQEQSTASEAWENGPGRPARRRRRDRATPAVEPQTETEPEVVGLPRGNGRTILDPSDEVGERRGNAIGETVQVGAPNQTVVVAPPPDDGERLPDPEAVADLRARQLERIVVSLNRVRAELADAEQTSDEVEIARLSEVERQLLARQAALEEAAAEGR